MASNKTIITVESTINAPVEITEFFEAENTNPVEMQQGGWQAIPDNFKKYTESN